MKKKNCFVDQRGVALVVALIMLLVLTFVGFAAVSLTNYESKIAGNERVYNNAFYASDGGIDNFRGRASTGEFVYTQTSMGSYQVAIGDCVTNVTYTRRPGPDLGGNPTVDFYVRSEGVSPGFPTSGRVVIESVVNVLMALPQGYN